PCMLASPLLWWLCIAACLAAAGAGVVLAGRVAFVRRAGARGRGTGVIAGVLLLAAGAAALWLILARGPWWLHAPTWVLIDRFPVHAPEADAEDDPVTAEIIDRIYEWELPRSTRERIAARCVE